MTNELKPISQVCEENPLEAHWRKAIGDWVDGKISKNKLMQSYPSGRLNFITNTKIFLRKIIPKTT